MRTMNESAPTPQRRLVSVLFLDVVGSTAMSRQLDPEDVSAIMDGALSRFAAVVLQHGGRVLNYAGDSLLAAFGADVSREDDAERAVHAGLALLDAGREHSDWVRREHHHEAFNVRVGVHTGHVLLGGGVDSDSNIRGFTVNIAARLEQTAPPGHLRISQDTWRQVRGAFEVEAQPLLQVKGQDEPLQTYIVRAPRPRAFRVAERGVLGQDTPLVGRDGELEQLVQAFEATAAGGGLQALTLLAEAGLGKSRLLHEFQHRLNVHPRRSWLLLGRAQLGQRLQPYALLRDVVAWRLQIADSANANTARAELVQGLAPLLGNDGEAQAMVLGHLIGMDFAAEPALGGILNEPRLLRDRALDVFKRWLQALADSDGSTVVLLIDDVQWADEASLDWLAQLMSHPALPLTLVMGARPALLELRPTWCDGDERHRCIRLAPLDAAMRQRLTTVLLQRLPEVPAALAALIEGQAEGNPYYAEELVQMLIDDGVIDAVTEPWQLHAEKLRAARIPGTLVGVLQARLDALASSERRALQQASIVGPVFWDDAVAALQPDTPAHLPGLQTKALVQLHPDSAFEGTPERSFHHHLLHQVTYDTVLKAERRSGHARAAQWLAERVGDRGAEYLTVTAEHYERAGDLDQALDWYERALDTAIERFANRAAQDIAARMLALPNLGDTPRRSAVLRRQTAVADLVADRPLQAQSVQERMRLAELLDDDRLRAEALVSAALLHDRLDERDEARRLAEAAIPVAERADDPVQLALAHGELAWLARLRGELAVARRHVDAGLLQAERAARAMLSRNDNIYEVSLRLVAAAICHDERDYSGERALAEQALALAENRNLKRLACSAHMVLAEQALALVDLPRAEHHVTAGRVAAASIGLEVGLADAALHGACLAKLRSDWVAMLTLAEEGTARSDRIGRRSLAAYGRQCQALALMKLGRPLAADALLTMAEASFAGIGCKSDALACRILRSEALWQQGDRDSALAAVLGEASALGQAEPLDQAVEALAARAAAWRVLQAAGDAGAPVQLGLAVAYIEQLTAAIAEQSVRERVRRGHPLHRELLDATSAV
jgi:class 3 adenylate cyclase/tetratricopeptide (TPR) repeat protein